MKEILLSAKGLCKQFSQGADKEQVLKNIDVDIYAGDFTVIMGSSGAGKSTLLYALSGMDDITDGKVLYKGAEISRYKERQMAILRSREFGFVFQQTLLVSHLSLFENVAVAGYLDSEKRTKDVREKAEKLLKQMDIEKAKDRLPREVSGGEAQRAAIARAVINGPGLLFADEPTGALNKRNTDEVLSLLTRLADNGQSILMVTHDIKAAIHGTRILYLEDGQILDEMVMGIYRAEEAKDREKKLSDWLAALSW
ncbi:MAG: ABC transporter ATP-binding protein [Bacillus sp. (in: Bacteria)]|nr:ABC transporter ATP-binding protein [Bacillus sp. (in: firmicutes)]MCM1426316.1 ABC transporter ATP-binding protein [Eubacterium sp.]